MLAEFLHIKVDQAATVVILLSRHLEEYLGAFRILLPQAIREIGIDPAVLLLGADSESQDLAFGQGREIAHRTMI